MTQITDLKQFLDVSPTAWHAVEWSSTRLLEKGFEKLEETSHWDLKPGKSYFVTRHGSTLAAFHTPKQKLTSFILSAAHTDSPALKLKPNAEYRKKNMVMLGTEVYGGPLLNSWLNRELGIAGRVVYFNSQGEMASKLINATHSPVVIPQLAIHLDKELKNGLKINKQEHLNPFACTTDSLPEGSHYLENLLAPLIEGEKLLSHDLFLYPLEESRMVGPQSESLSAYRLDNLASCHAVLEGICHTPLHANQLSLMVLWDSEEIGSETQQGAASPFAGELLERICDSLGGTKEDFFILKRRGLSISVDMAHAFNPNYASSYEANHSPLLGKGVCLKMNALQRYATNALSAAYIEKICQDSALSLQKFVVRSDFPCGSTIGPIHSAQTGILTVDIGIPQLSMHSARELICCQDHLDMCKLMTSLFSSTYVTPHREVSYA